jgi:hypothetical protein
MSAEGNVPSYYLTDPNKVHSSSPIETRPIATHRSREFDGFTHRIHLSPEFHLKIEFAFGQDFRDVVVEQSARATQVTAALETVAAASNNRIYLSSDFLRHNEAFREYVLAHEFAHIAQKSLARSSIVPLEKTPSSRDLLEAEAHLAAAAALRGRKARIELPDASNHLSPWGPAGHYYTCFFVMWAAGVDATKARDRAFFCQMPDQVFEFDATAAGFDYLSCEFANQCRGMEVSFRGHYLYTSTPRAINPRLLGPPIAADPDMKYQVSLEAIATPSGGSVIAVNAAYVFSDKATQLQVDDDVSQGLHALTGGLAESETGFREKIFRHCTDDLTLGLALHPYGDSFAHRSITTRELMYDPIVGHALAEHEPDKIGSRLPIYLLYVKGLYNITRQHMKCGSPKLSLSDTLKALTSAYKGSDGPSPTDNQDSVTDKHDQADRAECDVLKKLLPNVPLRYEPELEDQSYWFHFCRRRPHSAILHENGGPDAVYRRVRELGHSWHIMREAQAKKERREKMEKDYQEMRLRQPPGF